MSQFTRTPEWLRQALGIEEPDLPNRLGGGDRRVEPVLDVGQGGWGGEEFAWIQAQQGAAVQDPTAAGNVQIGDYVLPETHGMLWFGEITQAVYVAGGALVCQVWLVSPNPAVDVLLYDFRLNAVTAGERIPWVFSSSVGWGFNRDWVLAWVPPGFTLRVRLDASGNAGNILVFRLFGKRIRAGYKPL